MSDSIPPPDLDDLLDIKRDQTYANLNCIQIGKIESYNTGEQSAEIQLQVKRRVEGRIIDYPLLVDCPVIILQGGGAYIDLPVKSGDFCLVLFNDRDIDNWWTAATNKEPRTLRKHSLADGFALVGINPKISVLSLDGTNLNIWGPGGSDRIQIQPSGNMEIGQGGSPAARVNDSTIVDGTTDPAFIAWIVNVSAVLNGLVPGSIPSVPATATGKINSGSTGVTIK